MPALEATRAQRSSWDSSGDRGGTHARRRALPEPVRFTFPPTKPLTPRPFVDVDYPGFSRGAAVAVYPRAVDVGTPAAARGAHRGVGGGGRSRRRPPSRRDVSMMLARDLPPEPVRSTCPHERVRAFGAARESAPVTWLAR